MFGPVLAVLGFGSDDDEGLEIAKIVIEEYTRECPAIVVERTIDADEVVATSTASPPSAVHPHTAD